MRRLLLFSTVSLARASHTFAEGILIDQGMADQFLERELHPHLFEAAARKVGYPLTLRR